VVSLGRYGRTKKIRLGVPVSVVRVIKGPYAIFNAVSKAMVLADWEKYIKGKKYF
jgi:hypothetical protein